MYIPKNHKEVQNMVLHFNVTKDKRKSMVQAIEKEIGGKAPGQNIVKLRNG